MNRKGQTIVAVLGILVIFMIFIPALVYMVQHESKWTIKQKRTTAAFHAAEAGVDRAMWKIKENTDNFDSLLAGGTIPGYTGTTVYDVYSSTTQNLLSHYKVSIGTGVYSTEVLIRSIGRDVSTNEVRAIEVVLTKDILDAGMSVNGKLTWKSGLDVHWGPVVSYTELKVSTSTPHYPRKYSKFNMPGRDPDGIGGVNTDNVEWWSYQNLGNQPELDWAKYRELALGTYVPDPGASKLSYGTKVGTTGLFQNGNVTFKNNYSLVCPTGVIYVEGGSYQTNFANGSFLDVRAVVGEGSTDFNGSGNAAHPSYTANLPPNAWQEYQYFDNGTSGQYPGDAGFKSNDATLTINSVGLHGLLACAKNVTNAGGNSILVGSYFIGGEVSNSNTFTVYYDSAVAADIMYSYIPVRQKSWKEVTAEW